MIKSFQQVLKVTIMFAIKLSKKIFDFANDLLKSVNCLQCPICPTRHCIRYLCMFDWEAVLKLQLQSTTYSELSTSILMSRSFYVAALTWRQIRFSSPGPKWKTLTEITEKCRNPKYGLYKKAFSYYTFKKRKNAISSQAKDFFALRDKAT